MSECTATASTIQIPATAPVLLLAVELGESSWLLGFSTGFGETGLAFSWKALQRDHQQLV